MYSIHITNTYHNTCHNTCQYFVRNGMYSVAIHANSTSQFSHVAITDDRGRHREVRADEAFSRVPAGPREAAQSYGPLLGVGGTDYSVRVEAPVPPPQKKGVPRSLQYYQVRDASQEPCHCHGSEAPRVGHRHQVDRYGITGTPWAKRSGGRS